MLLIIAFHGCRREEPAILKVKHVRQSKEGIWYFNWSAPELAHLLKDVGSPRDVPVHKDVLALGFLEARVLGRDGSEALFPEAWSHGEMERHAGPFGQWYARFCDSLGIADEALDLHSWRHTVITLLGRAGVPANIREEIVGHESNGRRSELGSYDHGATLEILQNAVNRLILPVDVAAMNAAVVRSDAIDKSAAWPNLNDPTIIPQPKKKKK